MKINKISGYLFGETGAEACIALENGFVTRHLHVETARIDEIPAENCDLAVCEGCFHKSMTDGDLAKVKVGGLYRHFKGKLVKVLAISQDTESVGSYSVVYECLNGLDRGKVWHRPYDMFISEVDHKKYPSVLQKNRFELVSEELDVSDWETYAEDFTSL